LLQVGQDWVTLPQYFKDNGYITAGVGKLFHPGSPPNNDEPLSWSPEFPYYDPDAQINYCEKNSSYYPVSCALPEAEAVDYQVASAAVRLLGNLTSQRYSSQPFFLGVGFHKPHPGWALPDEYLGMYPNPPLARNPFAPKGMPAEAFYSCKYLSQTTDFNGLYIRPNVSIPDPLARKVRSAYYGAVSWMDAQVGRVGPML
jgi:arylsulfatase A-like enzyme